MRPEHPDRLSRLDEERLVLAQAEERADDAAKCIVRAGRASRAAVDDERLRMLGNLGVEVVEEHPQGSFGLPRARVQRSAPWCTDRGQVPDEVLDHGFGHVPFPSPASRPLPEERASRCRNRNQVQAVATTK